MSSVTCTETALADFKDLKTHNGTSMPKKDSAWLFLGGVLKQQPLCTNGSGREPRITVPHLPAHAVGTEKCNYFPKITQGFS